jgi:hypothetical protein
MKNCELIIIRLKKNNNAYVLGYDDVRFMINYNDVINDMFKNNNNDCEYSYDYCYNIINDRLKMLYGDYNIKKIVKKVLFILYKRYKLYCCIDDILYIVNNIGSRYKSENHIMI